ncbi:MULTISPECIES: hypothetical protein [unclassified Streptomyces]|uniref:hypothetical protein n=1 Tax=unclassified Streptomyces TaxID=2593676 RepID=UPI002DDA831E|nr:MULTISPECIES: hypothetical protein [unclassified Streptomyces]WSA93959.1 hypothetical protein OIE63_22015 [Streptomyces sp. NBC_01795]WSB78385.1 hypothetical protein OHB04_23145 [Streptomyces sp. NBC_01775]WSS13412.1 hypothetical protein OG533_17095 [Streptomyces sp. NBC_01186]WSS42201.1 hypothetical protein OG220_17655 [Streptomyces sp. NBC_01187]
MNPTFRLRAAVAGVVTAGLLSAGAATAVAAPSAGHSPKPAPQSAQQPVAKTNTVTADHTKVKPWEQFRLHGKVTGIKSGTTVYLQQKQGTKWQTLPGTSVVNRSGDYSIRVKLGMKGKQQVRTLVSGTPSNAVTVTVG